MKYTYLIWDFDGTLFDTYPALNEAIRLGLADLGVTGSTEEAVGQLLSETLAYCLEQLAAQYALDPAQLDAAASVHHEKMPLEAQGPFPGVREVCEHVINAGGKNYIITHRGHASLRDYLNLHHTAGLFADCITRNDGFPRKPDPAAFIALLRKHQLSGEDGLSIGDRNLDVRAAQGAGVPTCWFGPQPPTEVQPDYTIQHFAELLDILR